MQYDDVTANPIWRTAISQAVINDYPTRTFTGCAVAQHCYNGDVSFLCEKWKL